MLNISVVDARQAPQTASPAVLFRLRIAETSGVPVHAIALRCQVRIEPRRRRYTKLEQLRLYELFGDVSQWDRTLHGVTWANASLVVPTFQQAIEVDLAVACTYDLEVASAKYLHAVRDGDVPLVFLFSGTTFMLGVSTPPAPPALPALPLTVAPVPWDLEASFAMPAATWRAAMDQFFPGGGWVRLSRDTLDRLQAFRGRHAVVSWDEAIDLLLQHARQEETV